MSFRLKTGPFDVLLHFIFRGSKVRIQPSQDAPSETNGSPWEFFCWMIGSMVQCRGTKGIQRVLQKWFIGKMVGKPLGWRAPQYSTPYAPLYQVGNYWVYIPLKKGLQQDGVKQLGANHPKGPRPVPYEGCEFVFLEAANSCRDICHFCTHEAIMAVNLSPLPNVPPSQERVYIIRPYSEKKKVNN